MKPQLSSQCRTAHTSPRGFTLTEVAMSLGIIAFAFVSLMALIPSSLQNFRRAMDTTVTSQIAQRLIGEAQETDFDYLVDNQLNGHEAQTPEFTRLAYRYFDDQGNELEEGRKQSAQYWVITRVTQPGNSNPATHQPGWFASLPVSGQVFNPREMTILTVQVVTNPVSRTLPIDETTLLLDPEAASQAHINYQSYAAVVARNGYIKKS